MSSLLNVFKQHRYIFIFNQTLVHEIGHNLGMTHDVKWYGLMGTCRNALNDSEIRCDKCTNYQPGNENQTIGPVTGDPGDCCNGIMGFFNHPHYWSRCSSRDFQTAFVAKNWTQCMESISGQQILHHFLDFVYILMLSPKYFFVIAT